MKIVYVGNFLHPWTTETHVVRDARRIPGVEVVTVQEPNPGPRREASRGFLNVIEAAARDAQLLIYQRTWGLHEEAINLWRTLDERGCRTASYHLDLYFGLDRERTITSHDPFWQTDTVFTADGDPETDKTLNVMGIDHRWLTAACVSDECVVGSHVDGLPEIVFVGSAPGTYHREWPWRRELIVGLEHHYGKRFHRLPVDNVRIHGTALNNMYASVPVIVGDSLALPGHVNYWSDRFYETVGRGGYLIGPNVPGIEQHFTSGEHLDLYEIGDLDHVFELVDHALTHPDEARDMALFGQAHVRAHHTYRHRVMAMLDALDLTP